MLTATLTDDGVLPLPEALRKGLSLKPGDVIQFVWSKADRQAVLRPVETVSDSLFGCLSAYRTAKPVMIETMREAVRKRARKVAQR